MAAKDNHVILVNEQDEWLGTMEKLQAHQKGALHRALSVFILNSKNEILLQQRAFSKYHSGGLWSNTCCSHPAPRESTLHAAHRRLQEEMGFDCELAPIFTLRYKADVSNELIENEYDHIYIGTYDGEIKPNAEEANDYKFISAADLQRWMQEKPEDFTPWFHMAMPRFIAYVQQHYAA
ncbi:MAG TPA: isopentenyl-diphosphate Delta-isomerase [Flavipsychrobacter sp.]